MKKLFLAFLLIFPMGAFSQDSHLIKYKTDTQERKKIKIINNGDGTFSMAVSNGAPTLSGKTYKLLARVAFTAPQSLTGNGTGLGWAFEVSGGSATFQINGGSNTVVLDGKSISGEFKGISQNPSIDLVFLQSSASAQMLLEVAE